MCNYTIRDAVKEDAAELSEIYRYYVKNTAVTFEYVAPSEEEFAERIGSTLKKYPYLVAEGEDGLIGFAFARAFRARPAYDYSAETTIYLCPDARRKGYGKELYSVLEHELACMGIKNLYACIAVTEREDSFLNTDSPLFHEALGFCRCGGFNNCGYKFGNWYSMIWMEKIIGEYTEKPAPIIPYPDLINVCGQPPADKLSRYDDKTVRVVTKDGWIFIGEASSFPPEYGMHEYNVEEEGLQIGFYICFKREIKSICEVTI